MSTLNNTEADEVILDFLDAQFDKIIDLAIKIARKPVAVEVSFSAGTLVAQFAHACELSKEEFITFMSALYDNTYPASDTTLN